VLRFSANLGFLWPDRPLLERVAAAGAAGFKAVELHWPYDVPAADLRDACQRAGVRVLCLNTPVGNEKAGEYGLGGLANREAEFAAGLDQAIGYARAIGAHAIHVMAGIVPEANRQHAGGVFAENLRLAAERASDLLVFVEPINRLDRPGYLCSTVEYAASMIARVGAANLRVMFDVYHIGVGQGDVLRRLERHLPIIGHVQIAAVPSRAEPDEGEIAYGAVFATLERLGYDGWIGCEYRPRASTDEGLRWLHALGVQL
jgi:2-dehydrotetronate isomerase